MRHGEMLMIFNAPSLVDGRWSSDMQVRKEG